MEFPSTTRLQRWLTLSGPRSAERHQEQRSHQKKLKREERHQEYPQRQPRCRAQERF